MKKFIIITICLLFTLPALAKNNHKEKKQKKLPPGLEKKLERTGELPPGWEKKLVRGEILDDDLYKIAVKIDDWPDSKYKKYPHPKEGTELLRLQNRIIRITKDTREILEILGID